MEQVDVIGVAKGIGDLGVMIMICAFFLVLSGILWVFVFKWFKNLLESVVVRHEKVINDLLVETRAQNETLSDISAGLQPISQMQINSICNNFFELDRERLCRLVKNIRSENHINDKESTRKKIDTRVGSIMRKRIVELNNFIHKNKRLGDYMPDDWTNKLSEIVEAEIYNESGANDKRTYENIKTRIDDMKFEFFNRLNG